MLYKKHLVVVFSLLVLVTMLSFNISPAVAPVKQCSINLRWSKSYNGETWENVRTGVMWTLSFLGAALPKGSMDNVIKRNDSVSFSVNLHFAGFSNKAIAAFSVITDSLKQSEEYLRYNSADVGRFVMLTLNSSWHYYQITGAETTLKKFIKKHSFKEYELFPVLNSSVGKNNRLIKFSFSEQIEKAAFVAEEGIFDTAQQTLHPEGYEVMDIMPNGQLRFAVYDAKGDLIDGSPSSVGIAGKPSKCLWCHEVTVQIDYKENRAVGNFISSKQFNSRMDSCQKLINQYRQSLDSEIDFSKGSEHTYSEFLYICFTEPSAERLAADWKASPKELLNKLSGISTHQSEEFSFMNKLYHRKDIDSLAPYKSVNVPSSTRETGGFEPDYFKKK